MTPIRPVTTTAEASVFKDADPVAELLHMISGLIVTVAREAKEWIAAHVLKC